MDVWTELVFCAFPESKVLFAAEVVLTVRKTAVFLLLPLALVLWENFIEKIRKSQKFEKNSRNQHIGKCGKKRRRNKSPNGSFLRILRVFEDFT